MKSIREFYSKIYIIHWKPLTDRREYMEKKLEEFGLTDLVEWVDQYDKPESIKKIKNAFHINPRLLCVNQSHIYCYEQQLKRKYEHVLILEDDIDFQNINLNLYLEQAAFEFEKLDGDVAFLSSCCGMEVQNKKPPTLLYYDPSYITRCTGAYIVSLRCVESLLIAAKINCHAIDRILNYFIPRMKIRVLWSGLVLKQGSETGKYKSAFVDIRDSKGNYRT